MKWIKTDIDGTGEKWRLAVLREHGTMYYFPKEDFEDLVENYEDCEQCEVAQPCAHEWVACAPFGTVILECPKCGRMARP